jgi:hypothetical protein
MKKIITFPSIVNIRPEITDNPADDCVIYDFANLYKYKRSCFSLCNLLQPQLVFNFFRPSYVPAVKKFYLENRDTAMMQYNLGELSTEEATMLLMSYFSFLGKARESLIPDSVKKVLWNERERYLAIKDLEDISEFTHKKVAEALLQKAWCSQIVLPTESYWRHLKCLLNCGEPVIIVADTNPLIAHYFITLLKERFPDLNWINGSMGKLKQLTPTLSWASSYDYQSYYTEASNQAYGIKQPSILKNLIDQFGVENIELVDLMISTEEAIAMKVNPIAPADFFDTLQRSAMQKPQ